MNSKKNQVNNPHRMNLPCYFATRSAMRADLFHGDCLRNEVSIVDDPLEVIYGDSSELKFHVTPTVLALRKN